MRPRSRSDGRRQFPRTARVNHLVQEILADNLARIDDERLQGVTITGVEVDSDLARAVAFYDSPAGPEGDEAILAALSELRPRLQSAVNREAKLRRTPALVFRPDPAIRTGERIDQILRDLHSEPRHGDATEGSDASAGGDAG